MPIQIPRPVQSEFPNVRVPTDAPIEAFGGGEPAARTFQGVDQLAGEQAKAHQEKLDSAMQSAADEAANQLTAEESRLTLAMQKAKGREAFDAANQAMKDFDQFHSDLAKNIGNTAVREHIAQRFARNRLNLSVAGQRYATAEGEHWQDQTDQATWENNRNAAIANPAPERIAESLADTKRSVDNFAARKGLSPEATKLLQDTEASKTHYGVLTMILDSGNDLQAKTYYDANKDEFKGQDAINAAKQMQRNSRLAQATAEIDSIFKPIQTVTQVGDMHWRVDEKPSVVTMTDVLAKTKEIKDQEVRHMVESMARQRFADQKTAVEQQNEAAFMDIAKRIEQNPGVDPRGLATPDEWENKLSLPKYKDALLRLADERTETDPKVYANLLSVPLPELASYSDAKMLEKFGSGMTKAHYEKALERRNLARKGGPAYDAIGQHDATLLSVFVKSGLGGVKPSDTAEDIKKSSDKQAALMQFWETVDRARLADQHVTGKKADDETTRKHAEKAAAFLSSNIDVVKVNAPWEGYPWEKFGLKKKSVYDQLNDPNAGNEVIAMPRDFTKALYDFAGARPGTIARGTEFSKWLYDDRAAINRAYLAFKAGASEPEVRAAYLKGK